MGEKLTPFEKASIARESVARAQTIIYDRIVEALNQDSTGTPDTWTVKPVKVESVKPPKKLAA